MINLFFSNTAGGSGRIHRKTLGIENETFTTLDLKLHAGDISSPFNVSLRHDIYNAYFDLDSCVSEDIRYLKKSLKKDNQLCIWYSDKDVDEYLGMLATIAQFNGKGISFYKCDCSGICESVSYLQDKETIEPVECRLISTDEKDKLLKEWEHIRSENTPLRIIKTGKVIGLPADYLDNRLFAFIGDKETKIADVCEEFLRDEMSRKLTFLLWRIRHLINAGQLTVVSEGYAPNNGYYGSSEKDIIQYIVKKSATYPSHFITK